MLIKKFEKPIERLDEINDDLDSDKIFNKVMECTNRLLVNFNKRFICNKIIELIDKSDLVKFADPRNKLTNIRKPVFMLRVDLTKKCEETYPNKFVKIYIEKKFDIRNLDDEDKKILTDYKVEVVNNEVITPFCDFLLEEIKRLEKESEEFKKLKDEIRKGLGENDEEKLNRYIVPSIFTILVEKAEANVVKLEYIM